LTGLFITGGTGFLGRSLLPALALDHTQTVIVLSRDKNRPLGKLPAAPNLRVLEADLADSDRYRSALSDCPTVLHLAATTGKARAADYYRVNAAGTKTLLAACEKAGVKNFLFISSIAVKFPEKKYYPYALSKELAEALVKKCSLNYTIVRPTIIIGKNSPVLSGLEKLASLPLMPVFGSGKTKIQPIFSADLVRGILAIVQGDFFNGETLELGGPESISIEAFIRKIRECKSKKTARALHIPLGALIPLLGTAEKFLRPLLPLSAGQLYSFKYDGEAEPNFLSRQLSAGFMNIRQMLGESLANG
jgi:NADH dehydrogenase